MIQADIASIVHVEAARTFPEFVRATAAAYGDDLAVVLRREGEPDDAVSFREIEARSAEFARGLIARGVGKGTRVGLIFGNGPDFAIFLAAIARIGAIAVPISTLIKANELVRVLRQSDVAGLIVQRTLLGHDYVSRLCDALPDLARSSSPDLRIPAVPYLRWIISSGDDLPTAVQDMAYLTDVTSCVSDELLSALEAEVHPTDQVVEIYTSGSMALPKGVKHLHGPILSRLRYLAKMTGRWRDQPMPVSMPMFWVGGLGLLLLTNWFVGATSICADRTVTNSLMAMGTVIRPDDLEKMALTKPYSALGMSETFGPYSYGNDMRVPGYPLSAPLDIIADDLEVRVVDERGAPVDDGQIGEIQIRGDGLTPGLHKIERSAYFTPDGFYQTGDLGQRDGARIHFVGRGGDMIKVNGANVSPAEVELELQDLEGIESAYVLGLPDEERGQKVVAAVIQRRDAALDFNHVRAELRSRLSSFKVPQAYVLITRDEVPLLHSNKVSRRDLGALVTSRLNNS